MISVHFSIKHYKLESSHGFHNLLREQVYSKPQLRLCSVRSHYETMIIMFCQNKSDDVIEQSQATLCDVCKPSCSMPFVFNL